MIRSLFLLVLMLPAIAGNAQTEPDTTRYYDEVRSLVSFYEYMLNSVGSAKSSTRDKEVIITESYKKIFINEEVQVEDDLVLDRKVITNKDVPAYLRDVDFFFKEIQFDFENIEIKKMKMGDNSFYFLASFENSVNGTTIDDETHSSIKKRFIEINLNEENGDLKIASVYSTKVSREKELQLWWETLSYAWITQFKKYVPFDSISNPTLLEIASIDSLDLSGNQFILDLEPLTALRELKSLNISHTKIVEISPLRYAKNLRKLKASGTPIEDITALQYFENLTYLDLSQTELLDISILERLKKLTFLDLSHTKIFTFQSLKPLSNLVEVNLTNTAFSDPILLSANTSLKIVNLSRTSISQLSAFKTLQSVTQLDISETGVTALNGLENHPKLEILTINRTSVGNLDPLLNAPNLKKVFSDLTGITEQMASVFMAKRNRTIVVTNSEQVMEWWKTLSTNWKMLFRVIMNEENPEKEDIVKLMNLDSLDVSGKNLYELGPLKKFQRLRYLDVSKNLFTSFEFTEKMVDLEVLKGADLPVESTNGLEKNPKLRLLMLNRTLLKDIQSLAYLNKLETLNVDETKLTEEQVVNYLKSNPKTVAIYQSERLINWWNNLAKDWKYAFNINNPDAYHLHQLIEQKEVAISNPSISSLTPLNVFINLEKVTLDRVKISNLKELYNTQTNLRQLSFTNGPLQTLDGIGQLSQLESLNISNTAIDDLRELDQLHALRNLNCSGTGIKNLKGISELYDLENLNVSNTDIRKLDRLYKIKELRTLTCNNTKLRDKRVIEFKLLFPECEVTFY